MQADYQKHSILLAMKPNSDYVFKNKVFEIFFENYKAEALYPYASSSLIMFSQGRTTGLVIESGCSTTYSIPVYEGYSIPYGYW